MAVLSQGISTRHIVHRRTWRERATARVTWRLLSAVAPVAQSLHVWEPAAPVVATLDAAQRIGWDAAVAELLTLLAPRETRLGWWLDITEDHWGGLHYRALPRTPQDTRPTLETLYEARLASPLARATGVPMRYQRHLRNDDLTPDLLDELTNAPTMPALVAVLPAVAATVPQPRATPVTPPSHPTPHPTSQAWRPAAPGSLSVASLIDDDAKRHALDVLYGRAQPATQPLPARVRQQRRYQMPDGAPVIVPVLTTPVNTPATTVTPAETHDEREETPASC